MSSGSLKDLTKSIITSITTSTTLPLPDDLVRVIHNYLEKHPSHDETDAQRLQDELLSIYEKNILDSPSRYATFLSILRQLRIAIKGSGRLLQWWDKLCIPVLKHLGQEKGLAAEARNTLLDILVYDEDEGHIDDAIITSDTVAENLLSIWLAKCATVSLEHDDNARFVESQLKLILITFGRRRPKNFLTSINHFFVKKDSRILSLSLLCEFIRHQPPHLHQLLQTPLFENLLRCLQIDTSTRVVSLAITTLIMFLPHIPASLSKHLPALFNIYSRLLFWDKQRKFEDSPDDSDEKSVHSTNSWSKLSQILDQQDVSVPELLHYYTFLYGLYPMNFMSYIRKPQKFLRRQGFPGADEFGVEPIEIRQRSEPFRQVHLLHPNFFTMTIDQELSDTNRWVKSEASDVVTECMALYIPGYIHPAPASKPEQRDLHVDTNPDVPDQPLVEPNTITPGQSRHNSWRYTASTAVASPEGHRNSLLRRESFTSQSMPSIADSPLMRADYQHDSPTLPPFLANSPSHTQLQDLLHSHRAPSVRGGLYHTLTNESVQSLALSHYTHDNNAHVDSYLQSLIRSHNPHSPSVRPGTNDSTKVTYLQREIIMLKNDLNFERYLKQQHLTHIGQLRRKAIREARVEAETQNLINTNRVLRSKLEDAKRTIIQMKKESEKSRNHSRKWEADLTTKLRALKDDQKKWVLEGDQLRRDLEASRHDVLHMRQLVLNEEAKVINATQKVQLVESNYNELERLRGEIVSLTTRLRKFEADELEMQQQKQYEEQARNTITILNMQLAAKDKDLGILQAKLEELLDDDGKENKKATNTGEPVFERNRIVEEALAGSRRRMDELKKAHSNLLKRHAKLQQDYMDLSTQDHFTELPTSDASPGIPSRDWRRKGSAMSDGMASPLNYASNFPVRPEIFPLETHSPTRVHQPQVLTLAAPASPASPTKEPKSPVHVWGDRFAYSNVFPAPTSAGSGSVGSGERDGSIGGVDYSKEPIKPQSDMRVFGRGGVQNIGKDKKDKKGLGKKNSTGQASDTDGAGDAGGKGKKKGGISGSLRGIRGFV